MSVAQTDFFSDPNWPENFVFNSPKTSSHQLLTLNQPHHSTIELLSQSLEILDIFQNTDDQQFQAHNYKKTAKSINSIKIKKKNKQLQHNKLQTENQRLLFYKNKSLKKMKNSVETINNQIMYHQTTHFTQNLLTGKQKLKFDQVVCIKTFQQVKDQLQINLKVKSQKLRPGKKLFNKDLEQKMIDYIKQLSEKKLKFTNSDIRKKALEFSTDPNFKASKGWYERFQVRNSHIFSQQQKKRKWKE